MLTRRHVLIGVAGAFAAGTLVLPTAALELTDYKPELLAGFQESGEPFLIDFFATWCSTCAAQDRALQELSGENTSYGAIPVLRVDWDEYGNGELSRALAIPRRSTLVLMRGTEELGRLVAETRKDKIAALLDLARS